MSHSIDQAARRMTLLWFVVLSGPLLIGIGISLLVWLGNYSAPVILLPEDTLRMVAMGAMGLMLVISRPLRNLLLSPAAIAKRTVHGSSSDIEQQAAAQTQASMFLLLGLLDSVSMMILAMSLMQADAELALLNGIYTLILGVIAKPDFTRLIRETGQRLRQTT